MGRKSKFCLLLSIIIVCSGHATPSQGASILGHLFSIGESRAKEKIPDYLERKNTLKLYWAFYAEGENLKNSCLKAKKTQYASEFRKILARKSLLATARLYGMELASRAIGAYVVKNGFSEKEKMNLVERLVINHCSKASTTVPFSKLKEFVLENMNNPLELPSFGDKLSLFGATDILSDGKQDERGFLLSISLFRSFCSWNEDPDDPRLLTPLLRNPIIFAEIVRQMNNEELSINPQTYMPVKSKKKDTVQVICTTIFCRKASADVFREHFPVTYAGADIGDDLKRLYCSDFQNAEYQYKDQEVHILKWMKESTFELNNLMVGHFVALVTGFPDIAVETGAPNGAGQILKTAVKDVFDDWAKAQIAILKGRLDYEETITFEKIPMENQSSSILPRFGVGYRVSYGEFDRSTLTKNKITASIPIRIPRSLLYWVKKQSQEIAGDMKRQDTKISVIEQKKNNMTKALLEQIRPAIESGMGKFVLPSYKGDLVTEVMTELLGQIQQSKSAWFEKSSNEEVVVPVTFYFGPFVLKYFNRVLQSSESLDVIKRFPEGP